MDKNGKMHDRAISGLGSYIQGELISEMNTHEDMTRNNKLITLMARAANGDMKGKKVKIKKPFSPQIAVHNAVLIYFAQHGVKVVEK